MQTFRSRVDWWLVALVFAPLGYAAYVTLRAALRAPSPSAWVAAGVSALVLLLCAWLFMTTAYDVTEHELVVRYGPVRAVVPIASIRRIRASNTPLAGPALSMRRLEVDYAKYDTAIVSPMDRAGFIAALTARNPAIEVQVADVRDG